MTVRTLASVPVAKRHDPASSHEAGRSVDRASQCAAVLECLTDSPGVTGAELAARYGMDVYQVRRRLSDLKATGRAYQEGSTKCSVTGRTSVLWFPEYQQASLL